MVLTVTLNPAVDQTALVERVVPGRVHAAHDTQIDPAGKGVNVSRMVHRLGWPTLAFGFIAGDTGNLLRRALESEGVHVHFVSIPGQTRVNLTVVDPEGIATTFRGQGPPVPETALQILHAAVERWMAAAKVIVLAGSLPPGVPARFYSDLVEEAEARGVPAVVDAQGPALRQGLAAGPFMIKPNVAEAEQLLGMRLDSESSLLAAARRLSRQGPRIAVVSMGAQGAVCAAGDRLFRVYAPAVERKSMVGAGDAMVAGMIVAWLRGEPIEKLLALGTAAGAATASTRGTEPGTAKQVSELLSQVRVEELS